jgi:hypothetical protein
MSILRAGIPEGDNRQYRKPHPFRRVMAWLICHNSLNNIGKIQMRSVSVAPHAERAAKYRSSVRHQPCVI